MNHAGVFSTLAAVSSLATTGCASEVDWTVADMPSQAGRIYLVTGGTSGIGYETARALAAAGAQVVIAARDEQRGEDAIASIRQQSTQAQVRFETLDLADLTAVRAFGERLNRSLPHLDGLINNAGIMEPPVRGVSRDGYESQFAVNYLGHFALTAQLLPLLRKAQAPRVVTLSSIAARGGEIHFDDLQFESEYDSMDAYRQSKLACLMFALELQRRSDAAGWGLTSIASHPGVSRTNLLPSQGRSLPMAFLFQSAAQGAVPTLFAVTATEARGGEYYGPTGFMELRGDLGFAKVPAAARDLKTSERLWTVSESLTGTVYPLEAK